MRRQTKAVAALYAGRFHLECAAISLGHAAREFRNGGYRFGVAAADDLRGNVESLHRAADEAILERNCPGPFIGLGNHSTIASLLALINSFEEREKCDLQLVLNGDGSGSVMVPELHTKAGEEPAGWEEIEQLDSIEALGEFLAKGHVEEAELRGASA